jgi:hypothetical protein
MFTNCSRYASVSSKKLIDNKEEYCMYNKIWKEIYLYISSSVRYSSFSAYCILMFTQIIVLVPDCTCTYIDVDGDNTPCWLAAQWMSWSRSSTLLMREPLQGEEDGVLSCRSFPAVFLMLLLSVNASLLVICWAFGK